MTTGERIKAARKRAGMTQAELANKLGISYVGISQWENNLRSPKYKTLRRIAAALNVSVDSLLEIPDELQKELSTIADFTSKSTGKPKEELLERLIEDEWIWPQPYTKLIDITDAADAAVVEQFREISDKQLQEYLLEEYKGLNRRGRIEAVIRMGELADTPRFTPRED